MSAEEHLAADVRAHLAKLKNVHEIKMFGGIGFMLNGNMVAGVSKRGLLLRVGKDGHSQAVARPGATAMEMRGRIMEGYVHVDPSTLSDGALATWLDEAIAFVKTLPPKPAEKKPKEKGKRP